MANRKISTIKETEPNNPNIFHDLFSGEKCWWPDKIIEAISRELIEYCHTNQRALSIEKFRIYKHIPTGTWYDWRDKFPFFAKAHEEATAILAIKRYEMAAFREVDKDVIFKDQRKFDPTWEKDVDEYWALKKNAENVQKIPDIIEVPACKRTKQESRDQKVKRIAAERRTKAST